MDRVLPRTIFGGLAGGTVALAVIAIGTIPATAPRSIDCSALAAAFRTVAAGETIAVTGTCSRQIVLPPRTFAARVTIDFAGSATNGGVKAWKINNLSLLNGTVTGPATGGVGVDARFTNDLIVAGWRTASVDYGVTVTDATRVAVIDNPWLGARNDGARYYNVTAARFERNRVDVRHPPASTAHPDAFQFFGKVADLIIADNHLTGNGQGASGFRNRNGDPYYRISWLRNFIRVDLVGIGSNDCIDCTAIGNDVVRAKGSRWYSRINFVNAARLTACGNRTEAMDRRKEPAVLPCPVAPAA